MFKLNDYIIITRGESRINSNGAITINLEVGVDEEQIHNDCEKLVEMLKNLRTLLESNYSIAVMKDRILLTIDD